MQHNWGCATERGPVSDPSALLPRLTECRCLCYYCCLYYLFLSPPPLPSAFSLFLLYPLLFFFFFFFVCVRLCVLLPLPPRLYFLYLFSLVPAVVGDGCLCNDEKNIDERTECPACGSLKCVQMLSNGHPPPPTSGDQLVTSRSNALQRTHRCRVISRDGELHTLPARPGVWVAVSPFQELLSPASIPHYFY